VSLVLRCEEIVASRVNRKPGPCGVTFNDDEAAYNLAWHLEKTHGFPLEAAARKAQEIEGAAIEAAAQEVVHAQTPSPPPPSEPAAKATPVTADRSTRKCPRCPKTFTWGPALVAHATKIHGKAATRGEPAKRPAARKPADAPKGFTIREPAPGTNAPESNGLTAKGALAKIEERLAPLRIELAELEAARKVLLTLSAS
jgi:uncharacterized C2H2 Zn-finger protein